MVTRHDEFDSVSEESLKTDKKGSRKLVSPNGRKSQGTSPAEVKVRLQPSTKKVHNQLIEFSDFMSNPNLIAVLGNASKDEQVLRQAAAHPRAFLKREGVPLPPRTDVRILYGKSRPKSKSKGKIEVTVTLEGCVSIPIVGGKACYTVKGSWEYSF